MIYKYHIYHNVYINTHTTEYYSTIKRNEILLFVKSQMDLEGIILGELSQTEKDKYCMLLLIYGI